MLVLMIVISASKLAGLLNTRLGQPAVLGELLAGLLLGPTVFNIFGWPFLTDSQLQETVLELGVIVLMFRRATRTALAFHRTAVCRRSITHDDHDLRRDYVSACRVCAQ
jgi:Kef-type K+ transport system membrane component KefB